MTSAAGHRYVVRERRLGIDPTAVLVLSDADAMFGLTCDAVQMLQLPGLVGDMVVIGIGYPDSRGYADSMERRMRDFTPVEWDWVPGGGGGSDFLAFLRDQVGPWITGRWPGAGRDLTYFGHSLGGLFGSWLLLETPELFDRYLLSSPSLWWGPYWLDGQVAQPGAGEAPDGQAFFGIGSRETDEGRRDEGRFLPDDHPMKPPEIELDMVADLDRFVRLLRSQEYPGLEIEHQVFDGEYHATAAVQTLTHGLRRFPPPR